MMAIVDFHAFNPFRIEGFMLVERKTGREDCDGNILRKAHYVLLSTFFFRH